MRDRKNLEELIVFFWKEKLKISNFLWKMTIFEFADVIFETKANLCFYFPAQLWK